MAELALTVALSIIHTTIYRVLKLPVYPSFTKLINFIYLYTRVIILSI